MNRLALITLALFVNCACIAADTNESMVEQVTKGLRSINSIKGDPKWTLTERMEHYGTPGVGIAVVDNFEVVWHRVYGLADRQTEEPVTKKTLFQAGSISKPVAAFAALKMVETGQLSLIDPVNDKLTTWKIPENEFTNSVPVTLTHLTSHTGGLTVHGFPGYAPGVDVPTLVRVLNGTAPANTEAIFVDKLPGESWRYSGGGYTIMQQLMIDVSGKAFPELLRDSVLEPSGMRHSTYTQPLPADKLRLAAAGVLPDGSDVPGKRHTYPEMAAAGLWTTAEDLARFAIEVQQAVQGRSTVLSQRMAQAMLEPVVPQFGRGFGLDDHDDALYFQHGGWDEGFCAQLIASRDDGVGVAVMINSNHPQLLQEIVNAVAAVYEWDGFGELVLHPMPEGAIENYVGRYRYSAETAFTVSEREGRLYMQYVGEQPQELLHVGDNRFVRRDRGGKITFSTIDGAIAFRFLLGGDERQTHKQLGSDEIVPRELLATGQHRKALSAYSALMEVGESSVSEGALNGAGVDLVEQDDAALGLALLLVNTELYPTSANTWDSVGYAYKKMGYREQSITYYRKAVAIEPGFASAVAALSELESSEN